MKKHTFCLCLLISLFLFDAINSYALLDKIVYCTSSNNSIYIDVCKLDNKKFSGVFVVLKPVSKIFLATRFFREESSQFREIFKAPQVEWCSMVGTGKGKSNTLVKLLILPVLKQNGLNLKCPLKGTIKIANLSTEQKMTSIFPNGLYRADLHAFNNDDNNIANFSILLKVEP